MIIYIDKTIAEHCSETKLNEDEILFFTQLAISYQKGNCLLCGHLSSLEAIIDSIDGFCSNIFKAVRNKLPEIKSIVEFVDTVAVISYEDGKDIPDFMKGKIFVLKTDDAVHYNISDKCVLIGENYDDSKFYNLIALRYIYFKRIRNAHVQFCLEQGGGDTTDSALRNWTEERHFVLCIVDSDKKYRKTEKYPNEIPLGQTARKVKQEYRRLKEPEYVHIHCIDVHEVENLIPICVLEFLAAQSCQDWKKGVALLKKLRRYGMTEAILVYDIKNGESIAKSDARREYWKEVGDKINEVDFPQVGNSVLQHSLNAMVSDPESEMYYSKIDLDGYLEEIWERIGKMVFSWGCANRPMRA